MSRSEAVANALLTGKIIAILRGLRWPEVEPAVRSLCNGGLRFIEITVESEGAVETLSALRATFGDKTYLGAGSVTRTGLAEQAHEAGAQYLVSPGFFEDVSDYANSHDVLYVPGIMSATEVGIALRSGHRIQKLFPAGLLGPDYLRAIQAPYPEVRFFAVGNIRVRDVATYLRAGASGVAMGSQLVRRGDDPEIVLRRAREVVAILQSGARLS